MAVTATTVAAATTMMAAVAVVFLAFVLSFYIFICAKRYRGGAPPAEGGVAARLWFLFGGGGGGGGGSGDGAGAWCYEGGLDEASMAKLPCREVGKGEEALDCAVCITELAAGETARVLPRCGHGFHVVCVDMWLKSHSTCPLCRCPAVDEPPASPPAPLPVQAPEADPESPNFPTNVLFFGSQDEVSTGGAQAQAQHRSPAMMTPPSPPPAAGVVDAARVRGLRRLLGCGGASPPPPQHHHRDNADRDIEMSLAGSGETSSPAKSPHPIS